MTAKPRRWMANAVKCLIGAAILLMTWDVYMPIYADMEITDDVRVHDGVMATVKFQKKRACTPTSGTVVAFAHFYDGYRLPTKVVDMDGVELRLKNFPPSEKPVFVTYRWALASELPEVSHVTLGFYIRCITRIPQYVEWSSKPHAVM